MVPNDFAERIFDIGEGSVPFFSNESIIPPAGYLCCRIIEIHAKNCALHYPQRKIQHAGWEIPYGNIGLNFLAFVSQFIQLRIAEIKAYIDGNLDEVEHIEEETENENDGAQRARTFQRIAQCKHLNGLTGNTECITDQQENLKEQTLALGGSGNERLADGNRPGKTEAENG